MKRHKDLDAPNKNDDAQVFVLPPNLLEQLGIQLSNITGSLAERSDEGQYNNDNPKDVPGNGSSILETANLMKQSVFMSPTFVSTTATESLNQLNDISNIVTETYESIQNDNKLQEVDNVAGIDNTDRIEFSNIDINPIYNKQSENFMKYQAIDEYEVKNENGDMILTNESYGNCNNVNIDLSVSGDFDDHADEAYLSDGSTSNSGPSSEITNNNLEAVTKHPKSCNKIKILSEQIINHSDLNTIQNSHIQKSSACFLIPVDTIVTGKPMKESTNNQLIEVNVKINHEKEKNNITNRMETPIKKNTKIQDSSNVNQRIEKIAQEELISTLEKNIKINDENEKKYINGKKDITNSTNTVIKMNALVQDSLSVTHPGVTKEKTNTSIGILENGDENKVMYIRDISKDEKPKVMSMIDNTKEIISNTEKSSSKSKLCIQGVEKPGGTLKFNTDTVLKTYQRTNIRKNIPELLHIDKTETVDINILPEVEIGLDNIYISGYKHANTFCICSDFGQMANSESDISYEHIHFCGHNSVGCTLETLFSMYHDNLGLHESPPAHPAPADMNVVNDEDVVETLQNICWRSYLCENNYENEEVAIYESRTTDQSNSSPDQRRRSNRKRKSTGTERFTESVDFKSRRTIQCGVCDLILSEAEWNKHKDSEHDLIAWKDGQTIDMKNKDLLKKLRQKLQKHGILKCTFCKTNIKYLTKFVQHVIICLKRKVQNYPSTIENETTSKCDIEKKVLTPEPTRRTKRTSRNLNGRCDVSELIADNTCKMINHVDASYIQIQKSKSRETDIRSQSITGVQINTPSIPQRKPIETPSNLGKAITPKSIEKSKNNKKASDFEDSSKSRSVNSSPKRVVHSEKPTRCTRLSKTFEDTTKSTVIEISPKSTKSLSDCSPKTKKFKDTPKEETLISPKSSIKSINVSTNATEIKKIKSIQKSVNVDITTKTNLALDVQATLKTTKKPIGDVSHPKLTECDNNLSKSILACNTKSNSVSIDASSKTTKNTVEAIGVSAKATVKSMQIVTSKRQLKEIDIFSSPAKKITNIDSQSSKKIMDVTNATKLPNVKLSSKSTKCSTDDVISKRISLESKDSNKQSRESSLNINRKIVDAGSRCEEVDVSSTLNLKFVDAHSSSKTLRKYTRSKSSKETTKTLTSTPSSKEAKISNTPTKSETKSDLSSSTKRSSDITKSENIPISSKVDNLNSRRKINIINSQAHVNLSQTPTSVKTLAVRTATSDKDTTSTSNTQESVDASSSSNNGKNVAHASSKGKSITTSDDANEPPNEPDEIFVVSIKEEVFPRCAVCKQQVEESLWLEHIAKEHNYLAWREDETPLDLQDDEEIRAHLYGIVKTNGGLRCYKCNVTRKYVKSYLAHIRSCNGDEQTEMDVSTASADIDTTQDPDDLPLRPNPRSSAALPCLQRSVVCGVCSETILENKWIDHIRMEHKYLAWKSGEPPLNVNDEVAVKIFLQNISKYNGGLICSKCGAIRSYVKKWMDHEATCKNYTTNEPSSSDILNESSKSGRYIEIEIPTRVVKCAKCSKEMPSEMWIDHIEKEHTYLSWIEGQPPLEENDPEAVSAYLHAMVKKRGTLYCVKCGVTRKYPKAFLTHVNACEMSGFKREDYYVEVSGQIKPDEYECAVCHETGNRKDWKKHAMEKHYNVAWIAGEIPINLKNPYAVEKYLKEYRTKHKLICKVCGSTRASCYGFYAHILTCGKAENEIEHLMEMCDICNNTYLCIYRNQHKAMHREQIIKKEKKEQDAIKAEEESIAKAKIDDGEPMGKRRAAEKAKKVMEKYTSNFQGGSNVCLSCHIEFDNETLLKDHSCKGSKLDEASDSDVSVKTEGQEESEDDMEGFDSNVSDEEEDLTKRKRQPESVPKITLPFKVKDFNYYLAKSFENFCELHYTRESLFNNWRCNNYTILSEDESAEYLPSMLESCKIRIQDEWETYNRFEAQKKKDMIMFTGATVRCMQWVPPCIGEEQEQYLSLACFRDADCPRYGKDELPQHPGMLQIWNIGRFTSVPKLTMGLAHDFGTIWAMEWCPSGGRDPEPAETESPLRLGLLAIACSNGSAYILSVPSFYNKTQEEPIICNLKPVAELRLLMNSNHPLCRVQYQATSISWSPQKGHEVVMVGYADGTTALYDLNTTSPFLKATEKGVDIFYPFQDALAENSTITGVALCASGDLRLAVGGQVSASATGATMWGRDRAPAVRSHLAASSVAYTPNWPAALLCSDDALTMKSTNCMEWWGGGRRLGGSCAAGACPQCGRVCLPAPPFVRVLRAHPAYPELKKQIVATLKMVPLARKRKLKLVNDDLGMIVEPLTYDETIKKYGLEFKTLPKKDQKVASKLCDNAEQCAERFPLSDMPSAAFCLSAEYHNRLAIASHAGFVFIIAI